MKSSSLLFPVSLLRAELVADEFIEDTYLLKPNNSLDCSVQIAVTRLGLHEQNHERGTPVILLHGSFTNRGFWLSAEAKGFARALLDAGYDPWMVEARGHGDSPVNHQYKKNNIEIYSEFDLPAVQDFVNEQAGRKSFWVGHSLGGVSLATALAGGHLDAEKIMGIILFGSQVSRYPLLLRVPGVRLAARLMLLSKNRISGRRIGPEQEPIGIAREFVRWAGLLHGWKSSGGKSYWQGLKKLNLPSLGFAAKKDRGDPVKACRKLLNAIPGESQFYLLSKQQGFLQDYNHVNMVVSKAAEQDVWPKAIDWMNTTQTR